MSSPILRIWAMGSPFMTTSWTAEPVRIPLRGAELYDGVRLTFAYPNADGYATAELFLTMEDLEAVIRQGPYMIDLTGYSTPPEANPTMTHAEILALPMSRSETGAGTVGKYLGDLLFALWDQGARFSGKYPFGNSDWQYDLYVPFIKAGLTTGSLDGEGGVADIGNAKEVILKTIDSIRL